LKSPGPFEAAGLTGAVERLASRAVLEGAREELIFTIGARDRERNFLVATLARCTNEPASCRDEQARRSTAPCEDQHVIDGITAHTCRPRSR
jgi:hypothetical protein